MGQFSHQRDVLDGLVASAVLAHAQAGVGESELHVAVGIADGIADLLKRTSRAEQGEGAHKGNITGVGKTRGCAHHVGLRDSHVEMAVRIHVLKHTGLGGMGQVGVQHHYFIIFSA